MEELEELIVGVCLNHHGVKSGLALVVEGGASLYHRQLLQNMFVYINGLERRLQVKTTMRKGRGYLCDLSPSGTG